MADLIEEILSNPRDFNFFQAIALLEEKYVSEDGRDPIQTGRIRFEPDPSLSFPPNDISSIEEQDGSIRFLLAFMGLVGVSSPLPVYFCELIVQRPEMGAALYDFLAVFNHRMYTLFYRAWKKYHFIRNFASSTTNTFTRQIAQLAGLQADGDLGPDQIRLLAYSGALAGSGRGKAALQTILTDFFDGIPVSIVEFVGRWAPLKNVKKLGSDICIGKNAILGTSIYDSAGKMKVVVGPLKREVYEQFLPGSENIDKMQTIIESFLSVQLAYDIEIQLQGMDLIPVLLGADNTRLGETSSLGESHGMSDIHSTRIERL